MRLFLLLASLAFVGCQQVPVTGRSQFILVDESEVASLSAAEFAKMKKLPADPRLPKLREIGLKIVAAARRDDKAGVLPPASRWEFAIIDDKSPNAFAMPGGKIGFHTGMFAFAPTDDDIAVIMGHEVAHVICRHGSERVSQVMGVAIAAAVADEATRNSSAKTRGTWMAAIGVGAQYGVLLPFSRSHESESDRLGLIFMARAGYNPEAAPAFWTRFSKAGGSKPPEFLSTHPADSTRVNQLRQWMPEAKAQMPKKP
ncbi:MAG: M48 family peptidase [Verrucomicrobia bacterium]|nr:M48 family peptidase [Verrucomicrobiota bacterium]